MIHILDSVRPKKPDFVITRGYIKELWEMTISCWEKDPAKRPTVDYVLGMLSSAAEQWELTGCAEHATQDDWSSAPSTEESDSEH